LFAHILPPAVLGLSGLLPLHPPKEERKAALRYRRLRLSR
jgi:hypothetical protein